MTTKNIRWSANLAYAVGLITTDGSLSKDGRHIILVSKDIDQLKNFADCLNLNSKISLHASSFNKSAKYYHLGFSNVKLYAFLARIGLTPNKSLTLGPIKIADKFFADFLRGVIDGDGNISTWIHRSNGNRQWCLRIFSGSEVFIYWLKSRIETQFGVEGRVYKSIRVDRKHPTYTLKFGKKAALKIVKVINYRNKPALARKMLVTTQLGLHDRSNLLN